MRTHGRLAADPTRRAALTVALSGTTLVRWAQAAGRAPLRHELVLRPERGTEGFPYLYHEPSGKWVGQEIQLAVPAARPMPDPLVSPKYEYRMEVLMFGGLTIDRAAIVGGVGNRQLQQLPTLGDWYWWWINKSIGDVELRRTQRLGVQITWPDAEAGASARGPEPMEVFDLPDIDAQPPQQWTRWQRASAVVEGPDAQFKVAKGRLPKLVERPDFPFELRCRAALWDTPFRPRRD